MLPPRPRSSPAPETEAPGRHILLIGPAREVHPKVKALGHRLGLLCPVRSVRSLPDFGIYDRIVGMAAAATPDEWVAQAQLIHAQDPAYAIGGFNEVTQHLAARVAQTLQLAYHTPELIRRTRRSS